MPVSAHCRYQTRQADQLMRIDIISDTVCPWCFIGKRHLEKAINGYEGDLGDLEIVWRAFQLNPTMPTDGMGREDYLIRKFGPRLANVYGTIENAGTAAGISFNFAAMKTMPNSLNSHRLIRFAQAQGKADAVVERLFTGFFTEGLNIGDAGVLTEIAETAGLDRAETQTLFASPALRQEIEAEDASVREQGVNGVPFFILDGRKAMSGAQPVESFHRVFDLLLAEPQPAA